MSRNEAGIAAPPTSRRSSSGDRAVGAEPATRANLVERGDADLVIDLQASDVQSLEAKAKLKVISTPQYNALTFVSMNNQMPPSTTSMCAVPSPLRYLTTTCSRRRCSARRAAVRRKLGRRQTDKRRLPDPQRSSSISRRPRISEGSGHADGFSTTFSFNVGQASTAEPMAALVKESLAKIASRSTSRSCRMRRFDADQ